jgi:20S proteasome alpha/beta subunit
MTIALGIIASDGIVVAADTQVTVQNYWKGSEAKIVPVQRTDSEGRTGACAISGAGSNTTYLAALADDLRHSFQDSDHSRFVETLETTFEDALKRFHTDHVFPLHDPPALEMIIACQRKGRMALWHTDRSTIVSEKPWATAGVGGPTAYTMLYRLFNGVSGDTASEILKAVFVVGAVKDSVDGCGKFTTVMYIQDDAISQLPGSLVNEIESLYHTYANQYEPIVLQRLFGVNDESGAALEAFADLERSATTLLDKVRQAMPRPNRGLMPSAPPTA